MKNIRTSNGKGIIHLQYWGPATAKEAQLFTVGESVMWNGGSCSVITAIRDVSKCFVEFSFAGNYKRKFKKDRLVAVGKFTNGLPL